MARPTAQSVVALGGGHGLFATLTALRHLLADLTIDELTAVVTVADNGGSSGRLRAEFGVLPPGDLRMALAALCDDDQWGRTWADVVQHRFAGDGDMRGHVIGNLLIVGLWEIIGDPVGALDWVGNLLGAKGRVLPMSVSPIDMTAQVRGLDPHNETALTLVRGQVEVATTPGEIASVALDPADPEVCAEAVQAVLDADWITLGPGSWFTSVIPHLLVPQLRQALVDTSARLVVILNLAPQEGETPNFGPEDHLAALFEHAPELKIHTVVADRGSVPDPESLDRAVSAAGAHLLLADVAMPDEPHHEPNALAAALTRLMLG